MTKQMTRRMTEREPIMKILTQIRELYHNHVKFVESGCDPEDDEEFVEYYNELFASYCRLAKQIADSADEWLKYQDSIAQKLLSGEMLSAGEFRTLHVLGSVVPIELGDIEELVNRNAYDMYRLLYYRDDNGVQGLIDTDRHRELLTTDTGTRCSLFRIDPKDVNAANLTEEQRNFFKTHFPNEFARMQSV